MWLTRRVEVSSGLINLNELKHYYRERDWDSDISPTPPFCPRVVYHKKNFGLDLCFCEARKTWSMVVLSHMSIMECNKYRYIVEIKPPLSNIPRTSFMTPVLSAQMSKDSIYERSWIIPDIQMLHFAVDDCISYTLSFRRVPEMPVPIVAVSKFQAISSVCYEK